MLCRLDAPKTYIFSKNSLPDDDYHTLMTHGVNIAIIKNAGHFMSWENPMGFAGILHDLMSNE
ncbi:hypothetical protein LU293_07670 [Moraxella nasovis]|uniref:hypothetical protein n=1 Tax=Moraxella nasovis TaxID=2904121 RepID=UPI001F60F656|nr:hypothetical protein [Moraxella nasovis]UNU72958.1 hypothetical protein LU293_07670 [Moraxella nasovis]